LADLKCHEDVTFEPDFKTYNYDDKHYYNHKITAWSTTMPKGYKDTQFSDKNDEYVFTIGTSDATKLKSNHRYKTYFRTAVGNTGSDTAKVAFQRGNRTPSVCHSTWCIFAEATHRTPKIGWDSIPVGERLYVNP
jgi:hypothetical protein